MPRSLILERTGRVVASDLRQARGRRAKRRGLLGRDSLEPGEALLLERAPHIHTKGMRFAIDVVYCDAGGRVLLIARDLGPGRFGPLVLRARYTIEMCAGSSEDLEVGDRLIFRDGQPSVL